MPWFPAASPGGSSSVGAGLCACRGAHRCLLPALSPRTLGRHVPGGPEGVLCAISYLLSCLSLLLGAWRGQPAWGGWAPAVDVGGLSEHRPRGQTAEPGGPGNTSGALPPPPSPHRPQPAGRASLVSTGRLGPLSKSVPGSLAAPPSLSGVSPRVWPSSPRAGRARQQACFLI